MTPRLLSAIAPLADIAAVTCVALVPLMAFHIADAEAQAVAQQTELQAKIADQREQILFLEEFQIRCFYGQTMVVGKIVGVKCNPL